MAREITVLEFENAREASKLYSSNVKEVNPEDLTENAKRAIHRCVHFGLKDFERVPFYKKRNGTIFCEACNCEIARPTEYDANKEALMKAISVIDMLIGAYSTAGCEYEKIHYLATIKSLLYETAIPYLDAVRDCYKEDEK